MPDRCAFGADVLQENGQFHGERKMSVLIDEKDLIAVAIVTDGNRYVVVLNPEKIDRGWVFPGGRVGAGEDPESRLAESVLEETGISVDPDQFVRVTERTRKTVDLVSYEIRITSQALNSVPHIASSGHRVAVVTKRELIKRMHPMRVSMMQYQ